MAKYINTAMAIEALEKGLDVWIWTPIDKRWDASGFSSLTRSDCEHYHFAIGEKPTSPPRKMIEIDGVVMPAPIMRVEDLPEPFYAIYSDLDVQQCAHCHIDRKTSLAASGCAFSTRDDAIAARDARKLVLERAMERAK